MLIAIDAGNSRIKWALHDGKRWREHHSIPTEEAARIGAEVAGWPKEAHCVACNVAGDTVKNTIEQALKERDITPQWLTSTPSACGVTNQYDEPEKLGADRWAALIGAHHLYHQDCIVVCAGTATTVDWLGRDGQFHGGLILPGLGLMLKSLANNTAQLPFAKGSLQIAPHNTQDAIVTGCLLAQAGAIEHMVAKLQPSNLVPCILTGGAATRIAAALNCSYRIEDRLILEGLRRYDSTHG